MSYLITFLYSTPASDGLSKGKWFPVASIPSQIFENNCITNYYGTTRWSLSMRTFWPDPLRVHQNTTKDVRQCSISVSQKTYSALLILQPNPKLAAFLKILRFRDCWGIVRKVNTALRRSWSFSWNGSGAWATRGHGALAETSKLHAHVQQPKTNKMSRT
jgi:hypothetical protein